MPLINRRGGHPVAGVGSRGGENDQAWDKVEVRSEHGVSASAVHEAVYAWNGFDKLTQVTMTRGTVTQTWTFQLRRGEPAADGEWSVYFLRSERRTAGAIRAKERRLLLELEHAADG
jgi:hypothetical protein